MEINNRLVTNKDNSNLRICLDIDDTILSFMDTYKKHYDAKNHPSVMNDVNITRNVYKLRNNKAFWLSLEKIRDIDFEPHCYCTKRINPKSYTRESLEKHGFPIKPIYQMVYQKGNKADLIKGKVDLLIDDSISNFEQVNKSGVPCLLITAEHNKFYKTDLRIDSLELNEIMSVYNKNFVNGK